MDLGVFRINLFLFPTLNNRLVTLKWHFLPLRAVVEFLGYIVVTFIPHKKVS